MCRPPARCAPFTCTSACCPRSSSTIGSGSAASPRPSARKPRSAAAIATEKGILSRNASSGTTRISVGERSLQAALGLAKRFSEVVELLAEPESQVTRQTKMVSRDEQHAVLGAHALDQLQGIDSRAVLHEADRSGLRRVPAERVTEPFQPLVEHRVVRRENPSGAIEHLYPHLRLERDGRQMVARSSR